MEDNLHIQLPSGLEGELDLYRLRPVGGKPNFIDSVPTPRRLCNDRITARLRLAPAVAGSAPMNALRYAAGKEAFERL
jgi:hypothetical protein